MEVHLLQQPGPSQSEGVKWLMGEADDFSVLIPQEDKQLQYDAGLSWSCASPPITSTFSTLVVPLSLKK